jgi:CPA1 family monovalent cation:H+ antiporter
VTSLTLVLAGGLAVLGLGSWIARALRVPDASVWLALGILGTVALSAFGIDPRQWLVHAQPNVLPLLMALVVFETAYCVDARSRRHLLPAALLATGAFLITVWGTAKLFSVFIVDHFPVPWIIAVLAAVVLLPTDATPVAAQLRFRAPRGLRMMLRNELPFAATLAIVAFTAALPHAIDPVPRPGWSALLGAFLPMLAIGATVGAGMAYPVALALRMWSGGVLVHWLSVAVAVVAYHAAETLGGAGIAAVLCAGLVLGRESSAAAAVDFWRSAGRAAAGILVLTLGIMLSQLEVEAYLPVVLPIVFAMIAGRLLSVVAVEWSTHRWVKMGITRRELGLITVFSIRGTPTIALALALPDGIPYAHTIRTVAFVVVAFDLLVTAPLTPWLAKRFANHAPLQPLERQRITIPY